MANQMTPHHRAIYAAQEFYGNPLSGIGVAEIRRLDLERCMERAIREAVDEAVDKSGAVLMKIEITVNGKVVWFTERTPPNFTVSTNKGGTTIEIPNG